MPFRWLGQWLMTSDRQEAANWVNSLPPREYLNADFKTWPVGTWVKSSVHKHLRQNVLNFDDAATASVFASYLYSGVLASIALDRVFTEERPDAQLLFNGRMGVTRAALELGRLHGIRTICEERGYVAGRMMLFENANCLDYQGLKKLWSMWSETPLSSSEILELAAFLRGRFSGKDTDISLFSAAMGSSAGIEQLLQLDRKKKTWVLFTSSTDESADLNSEEDPFHSQHQWIDETLAFVKGRTDIRLIIRVHPNVGGKKSLGKNQDDLKYFESLVQNLPSNVRLVPSDSRISSYDLAHLADLGLTWRSTIALEMASLGRSVVRVASGPLSVAEFISAPTGSSTYHAFLASKLEGSRGVDIGIAAQAWRFAHAYFFKWSFAMPFVKQPKWYVGEMAYNSLQALQPGRSDALDYICDTIMNDGDLFAGPSGADSRQKFDEHNAISGILKSFSVGSATPAASD